MTTTYFVSYTAADRAWAEWIGWVLEETGATAAIQAWDFRAGNNFILEMQRAAATAQHTIAVLSPDYLSSRFTAPEWAAAFAQDPGGNARSLIPVRVRDCELRGLLPAIVYIDLVGLDEARARQTLLDHLSGRRGKPNRQPPFPGGPSMHPNFPGAPAAAADRAPVARSVPIPKIRGAITDLDRSRYLIQTFATIRDYFRDALGQLRQQSGVETSFTPTSDARFTAEIFVQGNRRARCKIWLGGSLGENTISYHEGQDSPGSDGALNEALTLNRQDPDLTFSAMMNMGLGTGRARKSLDPSRMTPEDAAEYLWMRFTWGLE